jgi:hypothetical protein
MHRRRVKEGFRLRSLVGAGSARSADRRDIAAAEVFIISDWHWVAVGRRLCSAVKNASQQLACSLELTPHRLIESGHFQPV